MYLLELLNVLIECPFIFMASLKHYSTRLHVSCDDNKSQCFQSTRRYFSIFLPSWL